MQLSIFSYYSVTDLTNLFLITCRFLRLFFSKRVVEVIIIARNRVEDS